MLPVPNSKRVMNNIHGGLGGFVGLFFLSRIIEELESTLGSHPVLPLAQSRGVSGCSQHLPVVLKISMTFLKLSALCYRTVFLLSPPTVVMFS